RRRRAAPRRSGAGCGRDAVPARAAARPPVARGVRRRTGRAGLPDLAGRARRAVARPHRGHAERTALGGGVRLAPAAGRARHDGRRAARGSGRRPRPRIDPTRPAGRPRRRGAAMRRAAVAAVACALAAAASPPGAAAQGRVPPGWPDESRGTRRGAFGWLIEQHPRLVVRPMAALLGAGTHEQRLNARATWPAADTAPDFALHLFAGLAAGRDA